MPKFSNLFKASITITLFFGVNKIVALIRQGIIAKQYGFSPEIDAFNIANNIPDLLASLIAGGAFAVAFIPVLSEYLHKKGRDETWLLFSRVANLVFLITAVLSLVAALFAESLVKAQFGIAPGFSTSQQDLVVSLMRLDLIGTLIFSLSGLVMSALQANKHFFLPALAPILYNLGQIFGALVLTPVFGMGIYGLIYGVLIGAILHLGIQIPGMVHYRYRWSMAFNLGDEGVKKVLRLMGPRIVTVLFIQIIFLTRDNLASRLQSGAVTALTYGYFIMQVPETLIGTALATALLPTISQLVHHKDQTLFSETVNRSIRIIIASATIVSVLTALSLQSLIKALFHFSTQEVTLLTWTTIAYLLGLTSQCLLEVTTRTFYAMQNARIPLLATFCRMVLFILMAILLFQPFGAVGLALTDSLAISFEVVLLLFILRMHIPNILHLWSTLLSTGLAVLVVGLVFLVSSSLPIPQIGTTLVALVISSLASLIFIRREVKMFLRL